MNNKEVASSFPVLLLPQQLPCPWIGGWGRGRGRGDEMIIMMTRRTLSSAAAAGVANGGVAISVLSPGPRLFALNIGICGLWVCGDKDDAVTKDKTTDPRLGEIVCAVPFSETMSNNPHPECLGLQHVNPVNKTIYVPVGTIIAERCIYLWAY